MFQQQFKLTTMLTSIALLFLGFDSHGNAYELVGKKYFNGNHGGNNEQYRFFLILCKGQPSKNNVQSNVKKAIDCLVKENKSMERPEPSWATRIKYYPAGYVAIAPNETLIFGYYSDTKRKVGWVAMDQHRYLTNSSNDHTLGKPTTNMALVEFRLDGKDELFELHRTKHRKGNRIWVSYTLRP